MIAEPLSHVLSLAEDKEQKEQKNQTLRGRSESILTVHSLSRLAAAVSTPPNNTEELRIKYKIMTNVWLLAQTREPGRRLYADLDKDTFMDFADELISDKNYLLEKQINGVKMNCGTRQSV